MIRTLGILVSVVLVGTLAGCLRSETIVHLEADGSGRIEVLSLMTQDAADQMREFAAAMAEMGADMEEAFEGETGGDEGAAEAADSDTAPEDFSLFPEADLREAAARYGKGVTFVSSEPVNKDGFEGVRAIYAFTDVRDIRLDMEPADLSGDGVPGEEDMGDPGMEDPGMEEPAEPSMKFEFERLPDGKARLVVHMPEQDQGMAGDEDSMSEDASEDAMTGEEQEEPSEEELAFAREMLGGLRFSTLVRFPGKVTTTNTPYVEGNTVTLFAIDFDALLADLPRFQELASRGQPSSMAEAAEWLQDVPGMKFPLDEEISIEFETR